MKKKSIRSIHDLDNFFENKTNSTLSVKLLGGDKKINAETELIKYLTDNFKKCEGFVKRIVLIPLYERLPKSLFAEIVKLDKKAKQKNIDLTVSVNHSYEYRLNQNDGKIDWDIDTIIKANKSIDGVCSFIKKSKFSPLEALAFIHDYVSTLTKYNNSKNDWHDWLDKDQFFAGAFLDIPEVVCTGYCTLMKEIIDNLKMPGLECDVISVQFEHLQKNYVANHARCFVKIKDKRYGLDQTVFDDPTWDNDESLTHKFTHFALPNNSLDKEVNKLYYYYYPDKYDYGKTKADIIKTDWNFIGERYNNSKNPLSQKMIELAYFNVIDKLYPNETFDEKYQRIVKMVSISYNEQKSRQFAGNLYSVKPALSKKVAKQIYDYMHNTLATTCNKNSKEPSL